MAFEKRNWLARIGVGLNKFLIGDKDSQGKQTLTNAPDSVTQQGDVISADNLNDLEDRIESQFSADGIAISGLKITKVWENPTPSATTFPSQEVNLGVVADDILVEYIYSRGTLDGRVTEFAHFKLHGTGQEGYHYVRLQTLDVSSAGISAYARFLEIYTTSGTTKVNFLDCFYGNANINGTITTNTSNGSLVPIAIYKIGSNFYN